MLIKKKRTLIFIIALLVTLFLVVWTVWSNVALTTTVYTITSSNLPTAFNGYRVAHISDLHNSEISKDNLDLLEALKKAQPDMIAITGDIIDSRNTNLKIALNFVEKAVEIAPCYYVTGNHEARIEEYEKLKLGLKEIGVTVLENKGVFIEKSGMKISLIGVNDPSFNTDSTISDAVFLNQKIQEIKSEDEYTILLSHRPELFETYKNNGVDLVLSGHAHGGQFRIPFIGGLAAPNQGLFPKYDAGLFTSDKTNMVVSRGIGNSIFPFRFNNQPELVVIELKS